MPLETVIPCWVPVPVVVEFEMIDVQDQQRHRLTAKRAGPLVRHRFVDAPAIRDPRERVRRRETTKLVGQVLDPQLRLHPRQETRLSYRLREEVGCAELDAAELERGVVTTRDEHDRNVAEHRVKLHRDTEVEPAHVRHFRIQQKQVGNGLGHHAKRIDAAHGEAKSSDPLEDPRHELNRRRVVVDNQDVVGQAASPWTCVSKLFVSNADCAGANASISA